MGGSEGAELAMAWKVGHWISKELQTSSRADLCLLRARRPQPAPLEQRWSPFQPRGSGYCLQDGDMETGATRGWNAPFNERGGVKPAGAGTPSSP